MKRPRTLGIPVAENIVPLSSFKVQASKVLKMLRQSGHPVVITKGGRAAGVVISPEAYDAFREREEFVAAIRDGLEDQKAGRVRATKAVEALLDIHFKPKK
jgi:prevent-host-death family protein